MKYTILLIALLIFASCSDLDIKNIKCNSDSSLCPENSVCVNDSCQICPINTFKSNNKCICKDNYIYNENLQICIEAPKCNEDGDCSHNQQCTIIYNTETFQHERRCIQLGKSKFEKPCDLDNPCQKGLSCIFFKDKQICTEACDLKDNKCSDSTKVCIPYQNLNQDITDNLIGICFPENLSCNIENNEHMLEINSDCNDQEGVCFRYKTEYPQSLCFPDECSLSDNQSCGFNKICIVEAPGFLKCRNKNINGSTDKCNTTEDCQSNLSCFQGKCTKLCRPSADNTGCHLNNECKDFANMNNTNFSAFQEGALGFCQTN